MGLERGGYVRDRGEGSYNLDGLTRMNLFCGCPLSGSILGGSRGIFGSGFFVWDILFFWGVLGYALV